jgi:hypothetical protein
MHSVAKIAFSAFLAVGTIVPAGAGLAAPLSVPAPQVEKQSDVQNARWVRRCHNRRCSKVWVGKRDWRPRVVVRPRVVIRPAPRVVVRPGARVVVRPAGSRHVRWCENRYRTYDRATDTFVANGGIVKRCNSPFR